MNKPLWSEVVERINILRRICARGRSLFLANEDSVGVDMFEHMENEVNLLANVVSTLENQAAQPAVNIADIRTLLEIGREAYSDVYVFVHGEDDNHYDALDAAIMAVLAAAARRLAEVEGLVGKWREESPNTQSAYDIHNRYGDALENCADELEAALTKEPTK